jgi:hypothetical protein
MQGKTAGDKVRPVVEQTQEGSWVVLLVEYSPATRTYSMGSVLSGRSPTSAPWPTASRDGLRDLPASLRTVSEQYHGGTQMQIMRRAPYTGAEQIPSEFVAS